MEINNCLFCGSEHIQAVGVVYDNEVWFVACHSCEGEGPECDTEQEAIEAWNKPGNRIKELEEALAVVQQTVREVRAAQRRGPSWYTKGAKGLYMQVDLHLYRAEEALKSIID